MIVDTGFVPSADTRSSKVAVSARVTSDLLLVGSLLAVSSEQAFRIGGELFGEMVFALPDGETGPRAAWVGYENWRLIQPHPDVETVAEPNEPDGIPRHMYDTPVYRIRDDARSIDWKSWPRIDDAIESYRLFEKLRAEGAVQEHLRFQVCLPFPESALSCIREDFASDYPIAERGFEKLVAHELDRLFGEIPARDLAIQWDVCIEVLDLEGVLAFTSPGAWERFTGPVSRLTPLIPEDALVGYHFCYGTFPEWPMVEATDLALSVRMANYAVGHSRRTVDWVHLAGPRYLRSEDKRFFEPLADLAPGSARVFLGIVLPIDGVMGLERRYHTASMYLDDFGVAMYCGFGRQPGTDGMATMREHRAVVSAVLGRGR
jgi:hypothetical protein